MIGEKEELIIEILHEYQENRLNSINKLGFKTQIRKKKKDELLQKLYELRQLYNTKTIKELKEIKKFNTIWNN